MTRKIVATFGDKPPARRFEVEYRDSQGEWLPAVGAWAPGEVMVASEYLTADGAKLAARNLHKVCGWQTRVIEAGEGS